MRLARLALVLLAILTAVVPLPAWLVEEWYSRRVYPAIQNHLTPLSNTVPIALLDVASAILIVALAVVFWRRVRAAGVVRAVVRTTLSLITIAALGYLAFVALWGLNYRRQPLETKIEFEAGRVTQAAVRRLGEQAARTLNATRPRAHADETGPSLEAAFASAQQVLGSPRLAVPGIPKRSMLELYFRRAAIDGMTNPFFLEIILNPDALAFERPFVTLHEWAHLAGYAHEAEASFVAWLACSQGDARAQYSGWLAVFEHVSASLPRSDRAALAAMLDPGPRQDLQDAAARYARSSPVVREAAREVYDGYLRANRVREGIASYEGVVRLMVGAGVQDGRAPRLDTLR